MDVKHSIVFPTLISEFNLSKHQCEQLVIEKIETWFKLKDPNLYNNNVEKFLNEFDLIELWKTFQECLDVYCEKANIKSVIISSSWCKAEETGQSIKAHKHPESVLSGVYYPYIDPNSSSLVFENPTTPVIKEHNIRRIMNMDHSDLYKENYVIDNLEFTPQCGILIVFPSHVKHWVLPNMANKRYTVVFNTLLYSERKSLDQNPYIRDYRIEQHVDK